MSVKSILTVILAGFCLLCGGLVMESGVFRVQHSPDVTDTGSAELSVNRNGLILLQQTTETQDPSAAKDVPAPAAPQLKPAASENFGAVGGIAADVNVPIGSVDPATGFKYRLVLNSKGAAIASAMFSEFDDQQPREPKPLVFLSPVDLGRRRVLSMAHSELTLVDQGRRLPLDQLDWKVLGTERLADSSEEASFEATIIDSNDRPVLRLTKTYRVRPDTYMLDCVVRTENLADGAYQVRTSITGPIGLEQEGSRGDMRKVVAAFRHPQGQIISTRLDMKALARADEPKDRALQPRNPKSQFLWAAAVNKYFAAIVVPTPDDPNGYADWIAGQWGTYYDPIQQEKGDETLGLVLSTVPTMLSPAGEAGSSRDYRFQIYLGPKDKGRFDKNALYRQLGFVETIDFMGCCCPAWLINPLAFGILAIMNWMYGFIGNYGVVIIILVFLMRLALHPITKKSQISMHNMSKLAPRAEEIKKKYANNKAEMNKKLMELYREQGASPIMGMVPMFVQMPIWIALWSAIYTSIDLRGAAFLPFWITDLSAPDALISWPAVTIPLVGWELSSLNLLPLLMGVAFYLQQKLMPTQTSAAANPQMAQQQKMMNIMMPLLFPLMLYNAPSGVNLYIMSSTFAGVIEQYVIRKHIREKEQEESKGVVSATSKTGGKTKKKKPKPFFRF